MEARRSKCTKNTETTRAAGAGREPELRAIGQGLVRARGSQATSRERRCFFLGGVRSRESQAGSYASRTFSIQPTPGGGKGGGRRQRGKGAPEPRHGAGKGQGAAGEPVDVELSRTGLANGNVFGNTLGGSTIPVRRVKFSPGVRALRGRNGQTIGHISSPGRDARAPQRRGRGFGPNRDNAQEFSTHHVYPSHDRQQQFSQPSQRSGPFMVGERNFI